LPWHFQLLHSWFWNVQRYEGGLRCGDGIPLECSFRTFAGWRRVQLCGQQAFTLKKLGAAISVACEELQVSGHKMAFVGGMSCANRARRILPRFHMGRETLSGHLLRYKADRLVSVYVSVQHGALMDKRYRPKPRGRF